MLTTKRKIKKEKSIAKRIFNDERLEILPLRSETKNRCPLLPILFNIVLEFQSRVIRKEK